MIYVYSEFRLPMLKLFPRRIFIWLSQGPVKDCKYSGTCQELANFYTYLPIPVNNDWSRRVYRLLRKKDYFVQESKASALSK